MNEITAFCQSLKQEFTPRPQDPRRPVRCWSEKDVLNGTVVDAYVIILRTRGCSWALSSGCTMCGYFNDSMFSKVSSEELEQQFETAMQTYKGEKIVKLFTSGSFLDSSEIPESIQQMILGTLAEQAEKISVESRPDYVTENELSALHPLFDSTVFEVGIGLETSNDLVRRTAINKGFAFKDYLNAVHLLKKHRTKVKTYVLLKPPFLTEKESLDDCIRTTREISDLTDSISLNPTNVQRHTVVEFLWKRDQYRPPWLWSIVEFLKQSNNITEAFVKCDLVGGGSKRGAHNCKACDQKVIQAIADFSLTQDTNVFNDLSCTCQEQWLDQLAHEKFSFGSMVDFSRWIP